MTGAYVGAMSVLRRRYQRRESPRTKQTAEMLRNIITIKITVWIVFDPGTLPLGYGPWVGVCTLDTLGVSIRTWGAYCMAHPWIYSGVNWLLISLYMVHTPLLAPLLGDVVRPQLLRFLKNRR